MKRCRKRKIPSKFGSRNPQKKKVSESFPHIEQRFIPPCGWNISELTLTPPKLKISNQGDGGVLPEGLLQSNGSVSSGEVSKLVLLNLFSSLLGLNRNSCISIEERCISITALSPSLVPSMVRWTWTRCSLLVNSWHTPQVHCWWDPQDRVREIMVRVQEQFRQTCQGVTTSRRGNDDFFSRNCDGNWVSVVDDVCGS